MREPVLKCWWECLPLLVRIQAHGFTQIYGVISRCSVGLTGCTGGALMEPQRLNVDAGSRRHALAIVEKNNVASKAQEFRRNSRTFRAGIDFIVTVVRAGATEWRSR